MAVDGSLNFDTKINTKGFEKGTKSLNNSLSGLNSKLASLAKLVVAAFSVKQVVAFTKACKEAYQVQFEAEAKLEQVMKNTMGATQDQIQSVKEYASELQKVGVIGDEVTLSGLQELGTYVENVDSLKTMSVVLDDMLAQQYGLNATAENAVSISTMLGKVLEGQTSALSRYGYKFDEAQEQLLKYGTEEQRVATLAQVVEASVGGMNEALARTPAGRLQQIKNTMGDVKEQFGKAVTNIQALFLPALERLAATLQRVADLAVRVSEALANVFGISLNQSSAVTGSISASVEAQDALTEAVKETNKAQKNNLASFDKINTLATETAEESEVSSGGVSMPVTLDETPIEKQISNLEKKLQAILEPFKLAWENKGEDLMESLSNKWSNLKDLAGSIVDSFKRAWTENNLGQSIVEHIIGAYTEYNNTIGNLAKSIQKGWEENDAGKRIFTTILKFINAVADIAERFWQATADWAADVNFAPLFDSIAKLLEVLEPIGEKIGEGLLWFYKNVILPFAGWVIEKALPASIDLLAAAIDALDPIIDAAKDTLKWLWESFLKPLGEWAGNIAIDGLQKLADVLREIGDYLDAHPALKQALGPLAVAGGATAVGGVKGFAVAGITMGAAAGKDVYDNREDIWDTIKEHGGLSEFNRAWTTNMVRDWGLDGVADTMEKISGFMDKTETSPFFPIWNNFWQNIGGKIYEAKEALGKFVDGWSNFWGGIGEKVAEYHETLLTVWDGITGWFSEKWDSIKEVFSGVGDFFKDTFTTAKDNVTNAWSTVSGWFSDIWESIKSTFSTVGSWFKERFEKARDNIKNAWSKIGDWFKSRWDDVKNAFGNVGSWFKERFDTARTNIKEIWGNVGNWFGDRWDDIKDKFKGVGEWFRDRFDNAREAIERVFGKIGGFFSGIWDDITNGLHNAINWAIDKINGLLSRVNDGINSVTDALKRALSIDIPDNVPVIGGTSFALEIPSVNIPQIPHLAQGTVVPANYGNFLAMLGDNKRETEVVSPLSTIKEALVEALAGIGYGNQPIHVHVDLDGREIGRVAVKAVNSDNARKGR